MDMDNVNHLPPQPAQDPLAIPATITLPVGIWNRVYQLIGVNPFNDCNPIIAEMQRQMFNSINPPPTVVREPETVSRAEPPA
jgi:hypothetical protein